MKKILLLIGFACLSMNAQVKKNKNLKHYSRYDCTADVIIEDFIKSNDYLNCPKSNSYKFYDILLNDNKIIVTEYNKMEQVQRKLEYEDLVVEYRNDFDVYTEKDGETDGHQGFREFFVSKDKKKIIFYWISYGYEKGQAVYILK